LAYWCHLHPADIDRLRARDFLGLIAACDKQEAALSKR
jgi:hypothetical protein